MRQRITFEVDNVALFDMLKKMNGNFTGLGVRVVGVLLTGQCDMMEGIGMGVYGVFHVGTEELPEAPPNAEPPA